MQYKCNISVIDLNVECDIIKIHSYIIVYLVYYKKCIMQGKLKMKDKGDA